MVAGEVGGLVLIDGYRRVAALQSLGRDLVEVTVLPLEEAATLVPQDARALPDLVWTQAEGDRDASLERMRKEMVASEDFDAAVFIGGMEGVERELELFQEQCPGRAAWPVGSSGGAARSILDAGGLGLSGEDVERLGTTRS